MNPTDLIRKRLDDALSNERHPGTNTMGEPSPSEDLSPFRTSKTYIVRGRTGQFDFPTLPNGSYCVYDANGTRAIRLTRAGKEVEAILNESWPALLECNPVTLTNLVLKFFDEGNRATHAVLTGADALRSYGKRSPFDNYVLDEQEMARVEPLIGTTSIARHDDTVVLRAITLCGWMHDKRNLGIEHIHIVQTGRVHLETREVLSKRIFKSVPMIRY